ncbi:MAG: TonB-dependent receptor [Parashewanella sp.]
MKPTYLARLIKLGLMASVVAAPAAFAEDEKIERIVVSGQKFDRELQETPTSVAVITEKQLEDQQLVGLYEVLDQIPNVSGQFGRDFSIRGINSFNVSGGGNSFLTSVYVDGASVPMRMIQQGGFNAWDVSQVEVLRGPQSTLQGRNALAGAIWITTQQPTYEWSGKTRLTVGQNGQREVAVAVGGELVEDQLAFRFSGENNHFDGVNENKARKENSDYKKNQTYRLTFLYEPKAIEGLSATLSYTFNDIDNGVDFVAIDSTPDNRVNNFDEKTHHFSKNNILNLSVAYDINDEWSLDSISTYLNSDYGYNWDGDQSSAPDSRLVDDRTDKTKSQELRLTYEGDKLKAVFGAYYSNLTVKDVYDGPRRITLERLGIPQQLSAQLQARFKLPKAAAEHFTNNVVMPIYKRTGFDPASIRAYGNSSQEVTSSALYTELSYKLTDSFEVFGGVRYDYEKQAQESTNITKILNESKLPDPKRFAAFDPRLPTILTLLNGEIRKQAKNATGKEDLVDDNFSELLPKLGASYFINDSISTHFTYQRGYRSGGVGRNIATNEIFTYDSEFTDNYELSLRSSWLNDDLVVNANLFYLDWKDQQVRVKGDAIDPVTKRKSDNRYNVKTINAGKSNVKGFEVEYFYTVNRNLKLNGGVGFSKSEFTDFVDDKDVYTGQPFARAPKWTANFGAIYTADNGLFAGLDANYRDSSADKLVAVGKKPSTRSSARTLVNARLGYNWEHYGVFLTAKNLLDTDYTVFSTKGGTRTQESIEYGAERQIAVNFTAKF